MSKNKCSICGSPTERPHKHHTSYFPEKTIIVCPKCHNKIHSGEYPEYSPPAYDSEAFYGSSDEINMDWFVEPYGNRPLKEILNGFSLKKNEKISSSDLYEQFKEKTSIYSDIVFLFCIYGLLRIGLVERHELDGHSIRNEISDLPHFRYSWCLTDNGFEIRNNMVD